MDFGFLKYVILIGVVLGIVFLSQSAYFKPKIASYSTSLQKKGLPYLTQTQQWMQDHFWPNAAQEAQSRGAALVSSAQQEKNNLQNSAVDSAKKFVATKILNALGVTPQELGSSCRKSFDFVW